MLFALDITMAPASDSFAGLPMDIPEVLQATLGHDNSPE
jgi:hypothetical protein